MTIITKYDYCQACHLLLSECRCESTHGAVTTTVETKGLVPIWLSKWTLLVDGTQVSVDGVVVKGNEPGAVAANAAYLKRACREVKGNKVSVVEVQFTKHLGEGIEE